MRLHPFHCLAAAAISLLIISAFPSCNHPDIDEGSTHKVDPTPGGDDSGNGGNDKEPLDNNSFPKTPFEIKESFKLSSSIAKESKAIIDKLTSDKIGVPDAKAVAEELVKIDGVVSAVPNETGDAVVIQQRNKVYLNLLLDDYSFHDQTGKPVSETKAEIKVNGNSAYNPDGKNAILLAPYFGSHIENNKERGYANCNFDEIRSNIVSMGYSFRSLLDDQVKVEHFVGDTLAKYDLILICTHGGHRLTIADGSGVSTTLNTGVTVDPDHIPDNIDNVALTIIDGIVNHLATVQWLESNTTKDFPQSVVFACACESYNDDDLAQYFFNHKASAYCGMRRSVAKLMGGVLLDSFVESMTMGAEFDDAVLYTLNAPTVQTMQSALVAAYGEDLSFHSGCLRSDKSPKVTDVYLFNPSPIDMKAEQHDKIVEFTWRMPESSGFYTFDLYVEDKLILENPFAVRINGVYSLEVDMDDLPDNASHWSIVANLTGYGNGYFGSYRSAEADLSITAPATPKAGEAKDLGLSVAWADRNIGADVEYEIGDYYAWGESATKSSYEWATYDFGKSSNLIKYTSGDGLTELEEVDDAASVLWKEGWRLPTNEEWNELRQLCNWTKETRGGVVGYKITPKSEKYASNSIFLPIGGRYESKNLKESNNGYYWSSTLSSTKSEAYSNYIKEDASPARKNVSRCYGLNVRPVRIKSEEDVSYTVSVSELNFVPTPVNESATLSFKITNTCQKPLLIGRFQCPDAFSTSVEGAATVPAGKSKSFDVIFSPKEAKKYSGDMLIISNASSGTQTVYLSGTGTKSSQGAVLQLSSNEIKFGDVSVKTLGSKPFTIYNTGDKEAVISSISCDKPFYTDLSNGTVVRAGGHVDANVFFISDSSGSYSGKLVIKSDASSSPLTIDLTATATAASTENALLTFQPEQYEFGNVLVGSQGHYLVSLTNSGHKEAIITSVICPEGFTADIDSGEKITYNTVRFVNVYFNPAEAKHYSGKLVVEYDSDAPEAEILLTGNGVSEEKAELEVSRSSISFDDTFISQSTTEKLTITNIGSRDAVIKSISCPSGFSTDFVPETLLGKGASITVLVTFAPDAVADFRGVISIESDAVNSPLYVAVSGTGAKWGDISAEPIDLGLSVKWATWNLGASAPEESGDYFAWAEKNYKSDYTWETYLYSNSSGSSFTKYCLDTRYGSVDGKSMLELKDDAAYEQWGEGWRVPTPDEVNELMEKCTWTWSTSKSGYTVTSKVNGNSIFIPAAGYATLDHKVERMGTEAHYWTSGLQNTCYAAHLYFDSGSRETRYATRYFGFNIRPVFGDYLVAVESVSLDRTSITLAPGETVTLRGTISPSNASVKKLYWYSDDESVARVDNGAVTAVKPGTTTITVSTYNGKTDTCKVIVTKTGGIEGPGEGGEWNW